MKSTITLVSISIASLSGYRIQPESIPVKGNALEKKRKHNHRVRREEK